MTRIEDLEPAFLRARSSAKWGSFDADIVPSNPAEMDFGTAAPIHRAIQTVVDRQQYGYTVKGADSPGWQLAETFCTRMEEKFGWAGAAPERCVVLNDLVQAVMATILAFSEPEQGVMPQVPS